MAIFSANLLFSEDQAVTADAASTNIVDLGAMGTVYGAAAALSRDLGRGEPIPLLIQVTEAFDNCTSVKIGIEVDDNSGFSSAKEVASETVLLADLVVGKQCHLQFLPKGIDERYLRVYYDVTGTAPTVGKFTAGITMGNEDAR